MIAFPQRPFSQGSGKNPVFRSKRDRKRASLERENESESEEGCFVVKGISKRVIVVRSPDPKIFEQAIFIIREDYAGENGVSESEVLRQARQAADGYFAGAEKSAAGRLLPRLRGLLYAVAGAAATALAWIMVQMAKIA